MRPYYLWRSWVFDYRLLCILHLLHVWLFLIAGSCSTTRTISVFCCQSIYVIHCEMCHLFNTSSTGVNLFRVVVVSFWFIKLTRVLSSHATSSPIQNDFETFSWAKHWRVDFPKMVCIRVKKEHTCPIPFYVHCSVFSVFISVDWFMTWERK